MSIVVSDSSPLICLSFLGRPEILHALFGTVYVPPSVAAEVLEPRHGFAGASVEQIAGVQLRSPTDTRTVSTAHPRLHAGEVEAISLAMETRADLLVIDEAQGRAAAQGFGIATIGTLGILIRAKHANLITEVRPVLDRLRHELNFYVSDQLYDSVVASAGE